MKTIWMAIMGVIALAPAAFADECNGAGGSWGVADPIVAAVRDANGNCVPASNQIVEQHNPPAPPQPSGVSCTGNQCVYASFDDCVKGLKVQNVSDPESVCKVSFPN